MCFGEKHWLYEQLMLEHRGEDPSIWGKMDETERPRNIMQRQSWNRILSVPRYIPKRKFKHFLAS